MKEDVKDYDPRVNEMLDRQVPLRLDAQADWAEALQRAESAGLARRGRPGEWLAVRMRSRRLLAPAFGIAVLVVAAAGTAGGVHWWPSSVSAIDTKEATSLVQYTLTSEFSIWRKGDTLALWRLPQPDGSACLSVALSSPKPTAPGTNGQNPFTTGFCSRSGSMLSPDKEDAPIGASLSTTGSSGLVYGEVRSGSGIARVEVRSANGSTPLAYRDRWFLGQLPSGTSSSEPAGYVVVGYDSNGAVAGQFKAPGSP